MRTGAGRPATHVKTSGHIRVDVRALARRGPLSVGTMFSWSARRGGRPAGMVDVRIEDAGVVRLDYWGAGQKEHLELMLQYTACNFGNHRPWFACPRCTRRVAVVYLAPIAGCRRCLQLRYQSQSEDALGRSWRRSQKTAAKLRVESGHYPRRPKGMRRATFERLLQAWRREENFRESAL